MTSSAGPTRPSWVYARAPGRIDLLGGGTDPQPFASDHGGLVLNVAITHHTHVTVSAREGARVLLRSLDLGRELEGEPGKLPLDGRLDLPAALANRLPPPSGCVVETWTELPPASGLSSSASLGVAALGALGRFAGRQLEPAEAADLHSQVERFDLRIWGGKQDPYACAHGGLRLWRFEGERVFEESLVSAPAWALAELERDLLLVYSGEAHLSGDIHNEILADYRRGQSQVRAAQLRLRECAELGREALAKGDLRRFAALLDENWAAHQKLHSSCATPRLHELIALGKSRGAWGAKVCGAGGGGSIVFHVPPERRAAAAAALAAAGARLLPFKFDWRGLAVWAR